MAAEVERMFDSGADIAVYAGSNIVKSVVAAFAICIAGKLVRVASRLEAEAAEQLKSGFLADN